MPISCPDKSKPRFRFKSNKDGTKTRLAFCGNDVVESVVFSKSGKKIEKAKLSK
jgi:hypothetical protein